MLILFRTVNSTNALKVLVTIILCSGELKENDYTKALIVLGTNIMCSRFHNLTVSIYTRIHTCIRTGGCRVKDNMQGVS